MTSNKNKKASTITVGKGRETKLGRRKPFRESRSVALVLTNGLKTEKQYFNALRNEEWTQSFHVSVKSCAPVALVEVAVSEKNTSDYDSVWCVCDVDDFDVKQAITNAEKTDVQIALSVPCFEVWLVLHLIDCRKPFQNATEVKREMRRLISNWDKTKLRFDDFRDGIPEAIERAKNLGSPPDSNPSTSVWKVIESLTLTGDEST